MRIIGLNLREMNPVVSKTLHKGWYPFGNYPKPDKKGWIDIKPESDFKRFLYSYKNLPAITVCGLIGMNGAGKSTLLDILYRIINNLAYRLLSEQNVPSYKKLSYSNGVDADLYCYVDEKLIMLSCIGNTVSYYCSNGEKLVPITVDSKHLNSVLKTFFYTIGVNYSIYAFNKWDYFSENDESINGEWLEGVFHKNDSYLAPITLLPYRKDGCIDIQKENNLAKQRVIALSILARVHGRQFPYGYMASSINYHLNKMYKTEKLEYLSRNYNLPKAGLERLISSFKQCWENELRIIPSSQTSYEMALFYIAYKTVKICLTYQDYYKSMEMDRLYLAAQRSEKSFIRCIENSHTIKNVVKKIRKESNNSINFKINQCINFLEKGSIQPFEEIVDVEEFIKQNTIETYDDVIEKLYPPFFDMDIVFIKVGRKKNDNWSVSKEELTLSQMSSGEKQLLYAMSYVLYHLKNIQSVNEDNYRVPYHHVNLIMDEVELYFHPDFQRRFISLLISCLSWCKIDRRKIRSINIIIATHSPFLLTDIQTENSLYLTNGKVIKVANQTFGGNYYDLLQSNFFFKYTPIGEISNKYIRRMVQKKNNGDTLSQEEIDIIGDPFVKRYLSYNKKGDLDV